MKNTMQQFKRVLLTEIVEQSAGTFLTVDFKTRDGRPRTINGRIGVHFRGKAVPVRYDAETTKRPYVLLWSVQDRGYRRVDVDSIKAIRTRYNEFLFRG